jgi:hypothetical protein
LWACAEPATNAISSSGELVLHVLLLHVLLLHVHVKIRMNPRGQEDYQVTTYKTRNLLDRNICLTKEDG